MQFSLIIQVIAKPWSKFPILVAQVDMEFAEARLASDCIYIHMYGCIYRQIITIPMGTTPLLANIFLHFYEYEFINGRRKGYSS